MEENKTCATCRWCAKRVFDRTAIFVCVAEQLPVSLDESCRFWDGFNVEEDDYYVVDTTGA